MEQYLRSHLALMVMLEQQGAFEKGGYQSSSCSANG